MNVKIGAIIKKLRAEKNVTQDVLANAIGENKSLQTLRRRWNAFQKLVLLKSE